MALVLPAALAAAAAEEQAAGARRRSGPHIIGMLGGLLVCPCWWCRPLSLVSRRHARADGGEAADLSRLMAVPT